MSGESGTKSASLRELVPDDVVGREGVLAAYETVADLVKAHHNLTQLQRTSPKYPGPNAKPEEIVAFMRQIGAPEKGTEYEAPQGLSEGDMLLEKFRQAAAEVGVTKSQFPKLAQVLGAAKPKDQAPEWDGQLREKWGKKYDENLALARQGLERLSSAVPGLAEALEETKAGAHPAFNELLLFFGKRMQNDQTPNSLSMGRTMNDDAARKLAAEWRKLVQSKATDNQTHPEYEQTVTRIYEIRKQLADAGYPTPDDPRLAPLTVFPTMQ